MLAVAFVNHLHESGEHIELILKYEVHMVAHQGIRMNAQTGLLLCLPHEFQIDSSVCIILEDDLIVNPFGHDMIVPRGTLLPCSMRHVASPPIAKHLSKGVTPFAMWQKG